MGGRTIASLPPGPAAGSIPPVTNAAPAFSVILPSYNRWPLVCDAVESARAQTVTDFEILLVDDGSDDDTAALARERWGDDARIRVYRQENGGISAARNTAIDEAQGAWCAFLDSDDTWEPGYLASVQQCITAQPDADVIVSDVRYAGPWPHGVETMMTMDDWSMPDTIEALQTTTAWAQPSGMCVRTSHLQRIRFSETRIIAEDLDLLYRLVIDGRPFACNREVHVNYKYMEGGAEEGQVTAQRDLVLFWSLEHHRKYAKQLGLPGRDDLPRVRYRARYLASQGRWREARGYFWKWWRRKPDSTKALRGLLRSLVARKP